MNLVSLKNLLLALLLLSSFAWAYRPSKELRENYLSKKTNDDFAEILRKIDHQHSGKINKHQYKEFLIQLFSGGSNNTGMPSLELTINQFIR